MSCAFLMRASWCARISATFLAASAAASDWALSSSACVLSFAASARALRRAASSIVIAGGLKWLPATASEAVSSLQRGVFLDSVPGKEGGGHAHFRRGGRGVVGGQRVVGLFDVHRNRFEDLGQLRRKHDLVMADQGEHIALGIDHFAGALGALFLQLIGREMRFLVIDVPDQGHQRHQIGASVVVDMGGDFGR